MHSVYEGMIAIASIWRAYLYDEGNAHWHRAGVGIGSKDRV